MSAMSRALIFALTLTAFTAKGDGELIAVADPISVDLRTGNVSGVIGAANLRYSPGWKAENASVRIESVLGSTTNVLKMACSPGRSLMPIPPRTDFCCGLFRMELRLENL